MSKFNVLEIKTKKRKGSSQCLMTKRSPKESGAFNRSGREEKVRREGQGRQRGGRGWGEGRQRRVEGSGRGSEHEALRSWAA